MTLFEAPDTVSAQSWVLATMAAGRHGKGRLTALMPLAEVYKAFDQVILDYKSPG